MIWPLYYVGTEFPSGTVKQTLLEHSNGKMR